MACSLRVKGKLRKVKIASVGTLNCSLSPFRRFLREKTGKPVLNIRRGNRRGRQHVIRSFWAAFRGVLQLFGACRCVAPLGLIGENA